MNARTGRIMGDIAAVAGAAPCDRPSYSEADAVARAYFLKAFGELGLAVRVDGAGNIRARLEGRDPGLPPVLTGSHIDTVRKGGRFDGLLGSVCALECVRAFRDDGFVPLRSVEVIIFAEEEAANFGITLLGSKLLTGQLAPEALASIVNDEGESAAAVIRRAGFDPSRFSQANPPEVLQPGAVHAMVELHIEQGAVLDNCGIPVGIVERIAGMETYSVVLRGSGGHAGAMAMRDRHDPVVGAAEVILAMKQAAETARTGTAVATVGKITARPGAANVIASEAEFSVDIRDIEDASIEQLAEKLDTFVATAAKNHGLEAEVRRMAKSPAVALDTGVVDLIGRVAEDLGVPALRMNSGAVHDSVMMAAFTRVGMIFVPSIGGLSHCPEEDTGEKDIEAGANVLAGTIKRLAEEQA